MSPPPIRDDPGGRGHRLPPRRQVHPVRAGDAGSRRAATAQGRAGSRRLAPAAGDRAPARTPTTSGWTPPASHATRAATSRWTTTLRTSVPGIWALGDCNGRGAFTHTAYNDYEIVAATCWTARPRRSPTGIPAYALFIDPPLGRVGMTEAEARAAGRSVLIGSRPMTRVDRAVEKGETTGFIKVVVDAETQQILGAAILGVERRRGDPRPARPDVCQGATWRDAAGGAHPPDGVGADPDGDGRPQARLSCLTTPSFPAAPATPGRTAGDRPLPRLPRRTQPHRSLVPHPGPRRVVPHGPVGEQPRRRVAVPDQRDLDMPLVAQDTAEGRGHRGALAFKHLHVKVARGRPGRR